MEWKAGRGWGGQREEESVGEGTCRKRRGSEGEGV
jgi:hypothetical protein